MFSPGFPFSQSSQTTEMKKVSLRGMAADPYRVSRIVWFPCLAISTLHHDHPSYFVWQIIECCGGWLTSGHGGIFIECGHGRRASFGNDCGHGLLRTSKINLKIKCTAVSCGGMWWGDRSRDLSSNHRASALHTIRLWHTMRLSDYERFSLISSHTN